MDWQLETARQIIAADTDPDEYSPTDLERQRRLANARAVVRRHEEAEDRRAAQERRRAVQQRAVDAASGVVDRLTQDLAEAAETVSQARLALVAAESALRDAIDTHDASVRAARRELLGLGLTAGPGTDTGADDEAEKVQIRGVAYRPLRPRDLEAAR